MSTTTILESYDTQMDYSGDFDVAMLTAGSSTDVWSYHSETIMDQDAHHDQSTAAADRESVEVDMEETYPDYADHESVEYEMADDEEVYQHGGGDLLDVEVYDASQLHSPVPMPAAIDTPQMPSGEPLDYTIHTNPSFTDPRNSVEASVQHDETHHHELSAGDLPSVEVSAPLPAFEVGEEPPPGPAVASTDSHPEQLVDFSVPQDAADRLSHAVLSAEATVEPSGNLNSGDSGHTRVEETEAAAGWSHAQNYPDAANLLQTAESEDPESGESHNEAQQYYEYNETAANVVDPHEISEGVYIDPPPAVLLTLPSSDHSDICLFNQPPTRTGSVGPSEEHHQRGQQDLILLLHHRPTLYYEPLTSVFEALRQEQYITQIPEFAEGELALDAYDLQLIVSEVRLLFLPVLPLANLYSRITRMRVKLHCMI
jgi:hypothetical protein